MLSTTDNGPGDSVVIRAYRYLEYQAPERQPIRKSSDIHKKIAMKSSVLFSFVLVHKATHKAKSNTPIQKTNYLDSTAFLRQSNISSSDSGCHVIEIFYLLFIFVNSYRNSPSLWACTRLNYCLFYDVYSRYFVPSRELLSQTSLQRLAQSTISDDIFLTLLLRCRGKSGSSTSRTGGAAENNYWQAVFRSVKLSGCLDQQPNNFSPGSQSIRLAGVED